MSSDPMPSQIWILGQRYTITRQHAMLRGCPNTTIRPDGEGFCDGICDHKDCLIGVAPEFGGEYARETLMHEIVHALDVALLPPHVPHAHKPRRPSSLSRAAQRKKWSGLPEMRPVHLREETVQAWSRGLYATIRDPRNRTVMRYLFEYEEAHPLFRDELASAPAGEGGGKR